MKQISEVGVSLVKQLTSLAFIFLFFAVEVWTQQAVVYESVESEGRAAEDNTLWYILLILLGIGLAGAVYWMKFSKSQQKDQQIEDKKKSDKRQIDPEAVDIDKELEWFRKNRKVVNKQTSPNGKVPKNPSKTSRAVRTKTAAVNATLKSNSSDSEKPQNGQLPVF